MDKETLLLILVHIGLMLFALASFILAESVIWQIGFVIMFVLCFLMIFVLLARLEREIQE